MCSTCVCVVCSRFVIGQYVTVHGDVISHVNISHVVVEDGGEYSCTADNRAGKVTHAARLNVYGKCGKLGVTIIHLCLLRQGGQGGREEKEVLEIIVPRGSLMDFRTRCGVRRGDDYFSPPFGD